MKQTCLVTLCALVSISLFAQPSDFIVLKKRNNRTIKTYAEGSFISAVTYSGFSINGYIKDIRNDSIIVRQEETRLLPTQFGTTIDTVTYTLAVVYQQIKKFNYKPHGQGFSVVTIPRLMMIGGAGYLVLESVNTAYRKESITDNNKLPSLTIAAGVAAAGFLWQKLKKRSEEAGGKYKIVYVKVHSKP